MKLVVGLGNPGMKYDGTRHNVGFAAVDLLAKRHGARWEAAPRGIDALVARWRAEDVVLAKPLTFMNLSGRSVRQVVDFYQAELADLLIVCDDINLPLGKLRVRARGTHGGHNGLRDIQNHLGTTEYARLRIGVGAPEGGDAVDYVLGRFKPGERDVIADAEARAAQAVIVWAKQGVQACMNQYNGSEAKQE